MISSGSFLHALRAHSFIHFNEREGLNREGGLFARCAYKGGLSERGAYHREGLIIERGLSERGAYHREGLIIERGLSERGAQ